MRGWGVVVQEVNQALADSFWLDRRRGALMAQVESGSPAQRAGLKPGDVVLGVNGEAVVASGDLPALLVQHGAGEGAAESVARRQEIQVDARLGGSEEQSASAAQAAAPVPSGKLGFALRPADPATGGGAAGLVVEAASGPTARPGVQAGEVVVAVNGVPARHSHGAARREAGPWAGGAADRA